MGQFGPNKRRKIPVPKRHGVRDPLKRLAEREAAIKDKVNNPPLERDVQEVSNRFKQFVKLKEKVQSMSVGPTLREKPKHKLPAIRFGNTTIQKFSKETEENFLLRASKIQQDRVVEADLASKFNVEVERDDSTGAIKLKKKKPNVIDELLKKKAQERKGIKNKKTKETPQKLSLAEKRALKKKKLLEKKTKEEESLLEEYQMDSVQFGEVVHGPPSLNVKPRNADKLEGAPRPGRKHLLLHSILEKSDINEHEAEASKKKITKSKTLPNKVDLKGKRKNLPIGMRMKIEQEQQNVVELYRSLKKAKARE